MYGYVRPSSDELKIREFESFRAVYCGLCHTLRRRGGIAARFTVNFDMTFLAMLLSAGEEQRCSRRCPRHPLRKRGCALGGRALDAAADCSVILAWWKLEDDLADGGFGKRLIARLARVLLHRGYRRCAAARPSFDSGAAAAMERLRELEKSECESLDEAADCFAGMLAAIPDLLSEDERKRVLRQLLYHLGRSVYILDAADDFEKDIAEGSYNPLRYRFGAQLTAENRETLQRTLNLSQRNMVTAFQLLPENDYSGILENTLTIGLPQMSRVVLSGDWKNRRKILREHVRRLRGDTV